MDAEETKALLLRYKENQCSEAEKALVEGWFMEFNESNIDISPERIDELGIQIYNKLPVPDNDMKKFNLWPITVAAAAVFITTMSIYLYFYQSPSIDNLSKVADVIPGGNKATIILSNGKSIRLSDTQTGVVIGNGSLSYTDGTEIHGISNNNKTENYQTIKTPKGGEYQIVLSDGSKVWLNAESSLKFPATFNGLTNRKVEISGEAYFEVVKDKAHPFVVKTNDQEVTVLGTHFNINAYEDYKIKTTLLEGSVKVTSKLKLVKPVILAPGEQATYSNGNIATKVIDLDLETAWKRGKIEFEDADLKTVMSMLERWYDIETIYHAEDADARFTGTVSRTKNISAVLKLLESTGEVKFKIEGRKVLVMN